MAHQTLPNILLSNASLVTKSCIVRFVDDDAFNPCALSNCSTGPSPTLAHGKSTLPSFQANAGCLRPGLFVRFRSISEQTAHRHQQGVSFRVVCFVCFEPSDPFQRNVRGAVTWSVTRRVTSRHVTRSAVQGAERPQDGSRHAVTVHSQPGHHAHCTVTHIGDTVVDRSAPRLTASQTDIRPTLPRSHHNRYHHRHIHRHRRRHRHSRSPILRKLHLFRPIIDNQHAFQ